MLPYSLIYTKDSTLELGQFALERFYRIAEDTQAGLVYSDYYEIKDGVRSNYPVIDYQEGSLRDDFNFGSVLFYNATELLKKGRCRYYRKPISLPDFINLRLKVSQQAELGSHERISVLPKWKQTHEKVVKNNSIMLIREKPWQYKLKWKPPAQTTSRKLAAI